MKTRISERQASDLFHPSNLLPERKSSKKRFERRATSFVLWLALSLSTLDFQLSTAFAQVPTLLHYQGRAITGGTNFEGTGLFKFALVNVTSNRQATAVATIHPSGFVDSIGVTDGGLGYDSEPGVTVSGGGSGVIAYSSISGGRVTGIGLTSSGSGFTSAPTVTIDPPPAGNTQTTYWSNDGTSNTGSQPIAAVSLPVTKGLYAVLLGDTNLPNMSAVAASVFANSDVRLRIWFNDGAHGFQQVTPDQRIAAVGYAMMAAGVPDGSITSAKIASGAVSSALIANGAVGSAQLGIGAVSAGNVADASLTAAKLASGQVVKSLNALRDDVTLAVGTNVALSVAGNTLTVSAGTTGVTFPDGSTQYRAADSTPLVTSGLPAGSSFTVTIGGLAAELAAPFVQTIAVSGSSSPGSPNIDFIAVGALTASGTNLFQRARTSDPSWFSWFTNGSTPHPLVMTLSIPGGTSVTWSNLVRLFDYHLVSISGVTYERIRAVTDGFDPLTRVTSGSAVVSEASGGLAGAALILGGVEQTNVAVLPGVHLRFSPAGSPSIPGRYESTQLTLRGNPISASAAYASLIHQIGVLGVQPGPTCVVRSSGVDLISSPEALGVSYTLRLADDGLPIEEFAVVFDYP